jgi:hypothetical protein
MKNSYCITTSSLSENFNSSLTKVSCGLKSSFRLEFVHNLNFSKEFELIYRKNII